MTSASPILDALEKLAAPEQRRGRRPAGDQEYWHLGIATPDVRRLAGRLAPSFRLLSWSGQVVIVMRLLEYGSDEAAHLGVFLLARGIDQVPAVDAGALARMVEAFRGWSVTDAFCIEVLQPLLLRFPTDILASTRGWSSASNRWKRRASVVLFTRKIGASGRYTKLGLAACERLTADPDDLVRKGVGWALKDLMRGDREPVLAYVKELRRRGVPSIITTYALRDVRGPERQDILAIKAANRKPVQGGTP